MLSRLGDALLQLGPEGLDQTPDGGERQVPAQPETDEARPGRGGELGTSSSRLGEDVGGGLGQRPPQEVGGLGGAAQKGADGEDALGPGPGANLEGGKMTGMNPRSHKDISHTVTPSFVRTWFPAALLAVTSRNIPGLPLEVRETWTRLEKTTTRESTGEEEEGASWAEASSRKE